MNRHTEVLGLLFSHQNRTAFWIFFSLKPNLKKVAHDIAVGFRSHTQSVGTPPMDHVVSKVKFPHVNQLGIAHVIFIMVIDEL